MLKNPVVLNNYNVLLKSMELKEIAFWVMVVLAIILIIIMLIRSI